MMVGELSLDGSVRHVKGVLPMAATARDEGLKAIYVPQADAPEAALIEELTVYPVPTLGRLVSHRVFLGTVVEFGQTRYDTGC